MPVLINPQDKSAINVPMEDFQSKVAQGWLVPLNDPTGKPLAVPYDRANDLVGSKGYVQPDDSQLTDLLKQTHYSSPEQQALTFGEGVVRGLTGPAYAILAPKTGLTTQENIREREQYNPKTSIAGDVAGTVGGTIAGVGLPGLIGKAGAAAGVAGRLIGKAGELAARGATEAALYSAADQIHERVLGDPQAMSENIMAHVGLGAALGSGLGLALTPVSNAVNRVGRLATKGTQKLAENDKIISGIADRIFNVASNGLLPGIARPAAQLAKKALVNSVLAVAPEKQAVLNQLVRLSELAEKTTSNIEKHAAGIFANEAEKQIRSTDDQAKGTEKPLEIDKLGTMVMDHAADPKKFIDKLNSHTTVMAESAPDLSAALAGNVANAVTFLTSKLPTREKQNLLDAEPKLSNGQISEFNRYAHVVENPLGVLTSLKNATLLPQDIETLSGVYPELYHTMRNTVMDKLISKMGKQKSLNLPYNKRMSLSLFLGLPLDSSLMPQAVLSNQHSFGVMQLQKQMNNQIQRASKSGTQRMDPMRDLTRSQRAISRR